MFDIGSSMLTTEKINKKTDIEKKVNDLEEMFADLKKEQNKKQSNNINDEIYKLLLSLDDRRSKMFKGAFDVIDQNDDFLGQSAESMTSLIRELPRVLGKDFVCSLAAKKEPDMNRERLAHHLGIDTCDVKSDKYVLIGKHQDFYTVFSSIRHRNIEVYTKFENDQYLYEALLLQAQAWIYQVVKG